MNQEYPHQTFLKPLLLKTTELKGQTKSDPANKSDLLDVTLACDGGQLLKAHKNKMAQSTLEEQVKRLQKHMGAILVRVRDLKASVDALKKKDTTKENKEIKEIMDAQIIVDKVIGANKDAIKRIDEEIKQIVDNMLDTKTYHASDKAKEDGGKYGVEDKTRKKCRYYDRGFCKYNKKCRFSHPEGICQDYLNTLKCGGKECCQIHPKLCRWDQGKGGCNRGEDCLHLI